MPAGQAAFGKEVGKRFGGVQRLQMVNEQQLELHLAGKDGLDIHRHPFTLVIACPGLGQAGEVGQELYKKSRSP